jgi:flavin reductase (DIM6/NTAB) family NADH-FMN oxidoreductase RutF
MKTFRLDALSGQQKQVLLQSVVAPRPICFASTISAAGEVNLSPFSFFNLFSIDPPVCVFSPSRRLRDGTTKHTLENIQVTGEVVINIVNYDMVWQTSLASCEYPAGVNEFIKAGFTMLDSETVRPPRVAESPVQMECTVRQVIPLDNIPGSGNLVLADVKRVHVREDLFDEQGRVDPRKLDLVARLGGDWYARITTDSLFEVAKPNIKLGIGIDRLPEDIKNSPLLSANEKAELANVEMIPDQDSEFLNEHSAVSKYDRSVIFSEISAALEKRDVLLAWKWVSLLKN